MESRKIKDSAISASSAYDASSVGPQHGRLHNAKNGGAWCPRQMISRDSKEYLEVDLEEEHVITALHTQGRFGNGQGQEYAEGYMVDYWRAGMAEGAWRRWKNRVGKELLTGNTDTYSIVEQKLDPPVIASKIRFLPYSDHVRTVCMRVEILGCEWTEGILSYSMPQGVKVSSDLDFTDRTYDGVEEMGYLSDGLGQLVDGKKGKDNFNLDISGFGRGYEWVGWTNDTVGWSGLPLEITFEFDKIRNFSAAYLYTNNLFTSDVQVFSHARVFFSTNGHSFNPEPVHFSYMPDLVMEHSRNVTIKLHHRFGRYLKIQLYFASKWILLSEVAFDSAAASGNFTDLVEDDVTLLPAGPEYPPQRDEVKSTTSKGVNLTISQSKTDGRTDEPESYIGFIVGALTVVILILVAAIVFIAFRNQRIKTIAGLTAIPTVRSDLECEKAAMEPGMDCKPKESVDRPELYDRNVGHHQHTISPDYLEVPDVVAQEYSIPTHKKASEIEKGKPPPAEHSLLLKPPPVPPPPKGYYTQPDINDVTLPPSPPLSPTVPSVINRCSLNDHFMLPLSPDPDDETASAGSSSPALEEESQVPIQRFPREKFRIVDKIGEGHFGDVHLCEMLESPEDAPNKLVVLHTLKVDTFRDQFVQEVKALARLKDPNVSRLLGASLDEEPLYAVREYGVMGDLCQFLQDHVAETATPLAPIACALSHRVAHLLQCGGCGRQSLRSPSSLSGETTSICTSALGSGDLVVAATPAAAAGGAGEAVSVLAETLSSPTPELPHARVVAAAGGLRDVQRTLKMVHDNIIRTSEVPLSSEYFGGVGYVFYNNLKKKRDQIIAINGRTGEIETARSLLTKCIRTALLLKKYGIRQGDVVTAFFNIQLNSCVPCIASYFIGAIPSFMDPAINEQEVVHQIKLCQPKVIITYDNQEVIEILMRVLETIGLGVDIIVLEKEKEFLEPQSKEESFQPVYVEDLQQTAAIFFSSGSTGYPKAICLSHCSIFDEVLLKGISRTEENPMILLGYDNYYWLVETWKLVGIIKSHGIRVISPSFDTEEIWRMIDKHKVTMLFFDVKEVKELYESKRPANINVDSVRALCVVGDRLPVRYQRAFKEMFPTADIPVIYGLTETGICTHFSYGNQRHLELMERHPESIGVPVEGSGVTLKVVDLDTGEALGPNKAGELRVKSRNLLNCYYKIPNLDHLDNDGWFKTGDVLKYDEDLCFYFEGRIKDIIVFQGWHVAPGILETKLKSHPAVKRAAVVGKPHPSDGEHPLAIVELSEERTNVDLMEIKEFVDEDMNDIYKLRGGIVAVKKLPVTITGKVKKGLLRKMMEGRMIISATREASDFFSQRS